MFGKNVRFFVTECQRNPFQTIWNIFSEDDLWYLIVYPQTHASGNTPVRSRSPFWLVNRNDFTWGDHALDFEETARGREKSPDILWVVPGFYIFWDVLFAVESWVPRDRDELLVIRTAEAFGVCEGASCTPTSIQQPWRMGWVKVWMRKNAELRHWWNSVQGFLYPSWCRNLSSSIMIN